VSSLSLGSAAAVVEFVLLLSVQPYPFPPALALEVKIVLDFVVIAKH
jgi:hypothetical protein